MSTHFGFHYYTLSMLQRMLILWVFVLGGIFLGFQAAQQYTDRPAPWTKLTAQTKPYWYTFYVFEAFLFVQVTYRVLMFNIRGVLGGVEETILDTLWISLLALEVAMVVGVTGLTLYRRYLVAQPKEKTQ